MMPYSILNHVLGPVMRGPSSSHTAASHRIATLARELLGEPVASAHFVFDAHGSYGQVYREQGSDLAFATALLGWELTDDRFFTSLDAARARGVEISFSVGRLPDAGHPNTVALQLESPTGRRLSLEAASVGGGAVEITRVDGWPAEIRGESHDTLLAATPQDEPELRDALSEDPDLLALETRQVGGRLLLHARSRSRLPDRLWRRVGTLPGVERAYRVSALAPVIRGTPPFRQTAEMLAFAEDRRLSLGAAALAYESALLGVVEEEVLREVGCRLQVMRNAVARGLGAETPAMQLLEPCARRIFEAEARGRLPTGGLHARAAARALAALHVNSGRGVVCAAPTGGASGTLPGVLVTLEEDLGLDGEGSVRALLAASAVGLAILLEDGTFAAEVAGCQVEIGAAGAMAAAAVAEAGGGTARQSADAAALALQNTMGSVCDPVQGFVEIPCHTRNAVAASSAFVCADLVFGGYANPIPLGETAAASVATGRMLPPELRCTALGGLSVTPSAQALGQRGCRSIP